MVRKAKRTDPQADSPAASKEEAPRGRIIERPDGFYWQAGGEEYGPFPTLGEAEADMQSAGDGEFAPPDTLQEAESELGISEDRKSTRLNSSHRTISYAVFCLKK